MNLDAYHFADQLEEIAAGYSATELANKTGIPAKTIERILKRANKTIQNSTARRIAEGLGYEYRVTGDKFKFLKSTALSYELAPDEIQLLERYRKYSPARKNALLIFLNIFQLRSDEEQP